MPKLKYIPTSVFGRYELHQPIHLAKHLERLKKKARRTESFDFYFASSAVFSSMIEGNPIDLDSYMRYTETGMNNTGKSYHEIQDLKSAYTFAKANALTLANFLKAHKKATKTLITKPQYRGTVRDKEVYVYANATKVYTGASALIVGDELGKLFADINTLLKSELSLSEAFYSASMIHLTFVKIHPFADGNGRIARLLEKWFLASKIGDTAWFIQCEKLYRTRLKSYYKNVDIGSDYTKVDYDCSLPFLLMLPMALRLK